MYIIKLGNMFLEYYSLDRGAINNEFIEEVKVTFDEEEAYTFCSEEAVEELSKKLYIILGVKGTVQYKPEYIIDGSEVE